MKREEVKGILPDITDEQLTKIMDLHGADIERQKQTITTLTTERDAAKNQLDEANKKLEGYDPDCCFWRYFAEDTGILRRYAPGASDCVARPWRDRADHYRRS